MPVVFVAASKLPTPFAEFAMHGFVESATGREHVVLSLGDVADGAPVLGLSVAIVALSLRPLCARSPLKGVVYCCICARKGVVSA